VCAKCRWKEAVGGKFTMLPEYKGAYFQDQRYNWASYITPIPNPTWEAVLSKECEGGKHHVFRQGNGVPCCNPNTLLHTTYFMTDKALDINAKITFFKATMDLLPTRAKKYKWGYTKDAICFLCHRGDMNIKHILTSCPTLGVFYKSRHNKIQDRIAMELVEQENKGIVYVDVRWETLVGWK
jgi:hypothetical protein